MGNTGRDAPGSRDRLQGFRSPADPLGMERPDMGRRVQGMVLKVAKGRGKDGEEGRPAGRTWKVPEIGAKGVEGAGAG